MQMEKLSLKTILMIGINFWSWDGTINSGKLSGAGFYIVSIIIDEKRDKAYVKHVYLFK